MHKLGIFELLDALSAMVDGETSAQKEQPDGAAEPERTTDTEKRQNAENSQTPPEGAADDSARDELARRKERDDAAALEAFYRRHEEISNRAKKNQ